MADIDLERKQGSSAWAWIVGALVIALLAWGAVELMDAGEPEMAEVEVTDEPMMGEGDMQPGQEGMDTRQQGMAMEDEGQADIAQALNNPEQWISRSVPQATVDVVEVPTDRGFWVSTEGGRMFVILIDQPQEEPKDINSGAVVRLTGGTFRNAQHLPDLEGEPLDAQTRDMAQNEEIFLVVDERNVEIVQAAPGAM